MGTRKVASKKNKNSDSVFVREVPKSVAAEASMVGSMLIDPQCIDKVAQVVRPEELLYLGNREIFEAIVFLRNSDVGLNLDAILLRNELQKRGVLEKIGGVEYLKKVLDSICSSANVLYYAGVVHEKYLYRELISRSNDIIDEAYNQDDEPDILIDKAERLFFALANDARKDKSSHISEYTAEVIKTIHSGDYMKVTGIPTGFYELDEITCGFHNGDIIIIAARPSMGKTTLALNMIRNMAIEHEKRVCLFTMEMSNQQIAERLLIAVSGIDGHRLRKGILSEKEISKLENSNQTFIDSYVYVDDTCSLDPLDFSSRCRRMKSEFGIEIIFLDYLQLMGIHHGRHENRQQEITFISRTIKSIARELDLPVVVLSQLNRLSESRTGHRPRMSDLRESGSIEQDADVVILLHREDYYHLDEHEYIETNNTDLIIEKQRCGPTGLVSIFFRKDVARFDNIAKSYGGDDVF